MLMNFGSLDVEITNDFQMSDKVIDSSDEPIGLGTGSLLPMRITMGEVLTINPWSFVLYKGI